MKGMPVTVTFCCVQFWIARTKNTWDFKGTRELVAREYQVAFELYRMSLSTKVHYSFDMAQQV